MVSNPRKGDAVVIRYKKSLKSWFPLEGVIMITVTLNEDNSLNITGQMQVGEVVPNRCCQGFDWTVAHIFPNDEPEWTSLWGGCSNPDCPNYQKSIGPTDHMRGVSSILACDLAEWMFEKGEIMNQRQKYPPLCEVIAKKEMPGVEHCGVVYGYVGVGTHGHVQDHTEDGRAMFVLNGAIHTFNDPDSYFSITKLPEPDYQQKYNELLAWAKLAYKSMTLATQDSWCVEEMLSAPDDVKQ